MRAIIRNGRWVRNDENPLDPCDLHTVHHQFDRIHAFAKDVTILTHDKIEILSNILEATPEQEKAILKILQLSKQEIESIM